MWPKWIRRPDFPVSFSLLVSAVFSLSSYRLPTTYLLLPSDVTFTPRRSVLSLSLPPTILFTQLSRESDSNIGSPLQRDDSQEPSKGQLLARYLTRTSRIADGGQGATHYICIDVHICIPRHLSPLMTHCACPPAPGNRSTRR